MRNSFLKLSLALFSLTLLFSACSNDDEIHVEPDSSIKLIASKTSIVPFEDIKLSIDVDLDLLYNTYDSITWKTNGVVYGIFFFAGEKDERDIRITDYRIGENKAYALGYKDGKAVSIDSVTYTVEKPKGDFFNIKWNTKIKNEYLYYTTGLTPNNYLPTDEGWTKIGGVSLKLNYIVEDIDREYVEMFLEPWTFESNLKSTKTISTPDINDFDWHPDSDDREALEVKYKMEYTFLSSYITELYGPSKYIYEGKDITQTTLRDKYNELFKNNHRDFPPAEIWITPTTAICLVQANNWVGGKNQRGICAIIAEPLQR